jgi:hypothetical protein
MARGESNLQGQGQTSSTRQQPGPVGRGFLMQAPQRPSSLEYERTFTVLSVSQGGDEMRDVYAKLKWAERHLTDMMSLGRDFLRPEGDDDRPLGIEFDNRRPPIVVAKFIAEEPLPIEISLHAGDLVHNARTALDHILARLKDHFGGDGRSGTFPITESDADWKGRIYPRRDGKRQRGPLDGLPCSVRRLIYREQPYVAYGDRRRDDPIAVLSGLDNTDKHRLLHHSFAYPAAERGLDLIEISDRRRVLSKENVWVSGQPIVHGTVLARFRIRGLGNDLLRVDGDAEITVSGGPLDAPRTTYEDMIARVRGIADRASALIDGYP